MIWFAIVLFLVPLVACGRQPADPTVTSLVVEPVDSSQNGTPSTTGGPGGSLGIAVTPGAVPYASALPIPTPSARLIETYVVQAGDTLGGISLAYGVSLEELVTLNGLGSAEAILSVGQALQVPLNVSRTGPGLVLMPDSEVVYSPAYLDFDVAAFLETQGGYLATLTEEVNGELLSGAEIFERVARQYSVGPRVLLALVEYYGGWVTVSQPARLSLGPSNPYYEYGFFLQLSWAANRVNQGYYDYKREGCVAVRFSDGSRALVPEGLNAGSVGLQNILALNGTWETWLPEMEAFLETYQRLFGDPFARAVEPLVPIDLTQPPLRLPWETGETFYYTGGPHAAYGSRSAWAAVDFVPPDIKGSCYYSQKNVTAAADGRVFLGETGEMYLDLAYADREGQGDSDGNLETGWVLLYLHVVARDDVRHGQFVTAGTPLGYASCEGGIGDSSHVHLARRYNGEWIAADGPVPLVLSGWRFQADVRQYDGTMVRDGVVKTACECWDETLNALLGE